MDSLVRVVLGFVIVAALVASFPTLRAHQDALKAAVAAVLAILVHGVIRWKFSASDPNERVISDGGQSSDVNIPPAQPGPGGPAVISDGGEAGDASLPPARPSTEPPDPTGGEG